MKTIHFKDIYGKYIYFDMDILYIRYETVDPNELTIHLRDGNIKDFYFKSPFRAKWAYRKIARQLHKH